MKQLYIINKERQLKNHSSWQTGSYNYGQENMSLESDICTKENKKGGAVDDRGKDHKPKVDGRKRHLKEEKLRLLDERKRQKQVRLSILVMPLISKTDNRK